ncbi:LacI family DNA-binding transcriptional regulator [Streptomyces sp. NPDC096040]|uniref:LacI family DNA-binding transcriptional regulator n=1 Tax=Streptomyces sp. NPDC096040 TaxID=3155541 RepID=UPI0033271182
MAAAGGVSRATVSFVLNDDPRQSVSAATRDRVRQAARDLGHVPHGVARALREGSSRVVVLDLDRGLEGNHSRSCVRGLDDELAAHGHVLLVRHGQHSAEATRQVLDAITPRAMIRFAEPYLTGHDLEDLGGGRKDGLAAHAALQIRHPPSTGTPGSRRPCRRRTRRRARARRRFAEHTVHSLGLPPLVPVTVPRPKQAGTGAVADLREAHPDVTAVAAFDDDLALRTLTALHDLGLAVPGDIAVIGYDDTEYGELSTPALTAVHIDAEAHGRPAARTALGLDSAGLVPVPARIIVRDPV